MCDTRLRKVGGLRRWLELGRRAGTETQKRADLGGCCGYQETIMCNPSNTHVVQVEVRISQFGCQSDDLIYNWIGEGDRDMLPCHSALTVTMESSLPRIFSRQNNDQLPIDQLGLPRRTLTPVPFRHTVRKVGKSCHTLSDCGLTSSSANPFLIERKWHQKGILRRN